MLRQNSSEEVWQLISDSLNRQYACGSIKERRSLSGGSINSAYQLFFESGSPLFVKLNRDFALSMFEAESDGLQELASAQVIRVPQPILSGAGAGFSWLITEYISLGGGEGDSVCQFGRMMAALHRKSWHEFGWHRDNTIGSTPQCNSGSGSWIDFYREHRLQFQIDLAARNGFSAALQRKGERLLADLDGFFSTYNPEPSLLHGDLWAGNRAFDEKGKAVIFDPAVYYGDREADIAMTELFGGFGRDFYAAYNESWPLDGGYQVRKTLYNLYHILNHANLFGGGYAAQAESMIDSLVSEIK